MTNTREQNFQKYDGFTLVKDKIIMMFFGFIPKTFTPNHVTMVRLFMIPFILYFLVIQNYETSLILFVIAAFTDALDGAMARTRNQITEWGKLFDPIADKILIGSTGIILIVKFLNPLFALILIVIESLLILLSFIENKRNKAKNIPHNIQANWSGKIKMFLQCVAIGFLILYAIWPESSYLLVSEYSLLASFLFAIISLVVYKSI
ncbi:MAG: hypothetical protein QG614_355 [Patescibacteria group bacterium]|nr:hypothetical protein [Patescibacteria group bacterium]